MNVALLSLYGIENTGIRSISSVLKQNGHRVYLIFFKRWLNNDIKLPEFKEKQLLVTLLKDLKIEVVGFSFTSPFYKIAQTLSELIRRQLNLKIIWGGIHATVLPQQCLRHCDVVCRGEGEFAILEYLQALNCRRPLAGIKNLCWAKENKIYIEELRPLISDLDSLPFLDYSPENKFYIDKKLYQQDPMKFARELRVFASRGCPFNCSYCYNSIFRELYKGQRYYRIKSVSRVILEIEYALQHLKHVKKIKFDDDTFIFPKTWIEDFVNQYRKRIGLPFEILYNTYCADEWSLRKLKKAGLKRIQVGLQTASERESTQVYNRDLDKKKVKEFAHLAKKIKLDVVYDIILDNPLAMYEEKEELVKFLCQLPQPFNLFLYSLTVFPGTKLEKLLLSQGLITREEVEGWANKSFTQFRFSFNYPRAKEETFIAALVTLTSKRFFPKILILFFLRNNFFKRYPTLVKYLAQILTSLKLVYIGIKMFCEGTLNFWKLREYGLPKRFLIQ